MRAGCWLLLIALQLALALAGLAQDTGQICAQSFEDRDADGLRDPDEWAIRHGIGASLQNSAGVTIASRLLEDSPFAADGLLCFDQLLAGDYQLSLRSSEFTSTTAAAFAASVQPGAAPMLVEFGAQPLVTAASSRREAPFFIDAATLNALLRGLLGSLVMFLIMSLIGALIYVVVFRRRLKRAALKPYSAPVSAAPLSFAHDEADAPRAN